MKRPVLLDLYCGAGGAAMGYHRAGFDVVGVDKDPQPDYPFEFHRGDALEYLVENGHRYAARHASPPCGGYSTITPDPTKHPRHIAVVRILLRHIGGPYVIENVEGAQRQLIHPVKLCGSPFGLGVQRHRYFESNVPMFSLACQHALQGRPIGVYGDHPQDDSEYRRPDGTRRGQKARDVGQAREAMGIDWMGWHGLTQAIPPAYTEYIGEHLLSVCENGAL